MKHLLRTLIIISSIIISFSCCNQPIKVDGNSVNNNSQISSQINDDSLILILSKQILTSIKNKDYQKLSTFIHPTLGVRFSPYAFVDTIHDIKLNSDNFLNEIKTKNKFNWGSFDGSGDTILLSISNYFNRFVYDADFLNAEKISLNKMIGGGNSLNNLETVYTNCKYSESYFSGFDKKYDGMDWRSLRLVFKKYIDKFYLIGIVHDEWTI